jgi:hypothetical protein
MADIDFGDFLDNLRTDLEVALTGVKIRTLPQAPDENPAEGISFDAVEGGHDWHTMGPSFRDGFNVDGRIWAIAAETGSESGTAARDRAIAFLEAITAVFEDETSTVRTGTGAVLSARVDRYRYQPFPLPDGSWLAQIEFTIAVVSLV